MPTVKTIAAQHGLEQIISRAHSFHPQLQSRAQSILGTEVNYSDRLQTSAGNFAPRKNLISLHPAFLGPRTRTQDHLETFLHELAHLHQWVVYGRCDHGATWWEMMHQLGQKPVRTHEFVDSLQCSQSTSLSLDEIGL